MEEELEEGNLTLAHSEFTETQRLDAGLDALDGTSLFPELGVELTSDLIMINSVRLQIAQISDHALAPGRLMLVCKLNDTAISQYQNMQGLNIGKAFEEAGQHFDIIADPKRHR